MGNLGHMQGWLVVNGFFKSEKFDKHYRSLIDAAAGVGVELRIVGTDDASVFLSEDACAACAQRVAQGPSVHDAAVGETVLQGAPLPDFVLFWDKDVELARLIEQLGVPVFNTPDAIELCDNKATTYVALRAAGIPMPRTLLVPLAYSLPQWDETPFVDKAIEALGFPLVAKECQGSFGERVHKVCSREQLVDVLTSFEARPAVLQEFVAESEGRDARLQVVGDRVVAAARRFSKSGDFRANAAQGSTLEAFDPPEEFTQLALRVCRLLGLDFGGVDLLFGANGEPVLCEVNSNAHFAALSASSGVDVAHELLSYVAKETTRRARGRWATGAPLLSPSCACAAADFDPVAYIRNPAWSASVLGLERVKTLLTRMGNPQDRLRTVHIAGTNGKGSVSSYVEAILRAAGMKTGRFSSPGVFSFAETITVDGLPVDEASLRAATCYVRSCVESLQREGAFGEVGHPSEFELSVAVACEHFVRSGCDAVLLEVGLGGADDATNVLAAPELCVITRIALDHTVFLGDTLGAIARHKAGIIKSGCTVVSAAQQPEVLAIIQDAAQRVEATLRVVDEDALRVGAVSLDEEPALRAFTYGRNAYETQLLGAYQPENAALAIEAAHALRSRGWDIPDDAIVRGIEWATWPCRFELTSVAGRAGERLTLVVDGGHNPQGASALAASLRDVFPARKFVFIMGVMADKAYGEMLDEVIPFAEVFVTYEPDNPRALAASDLARAIAARGVSAVAAASAADAIDKAVDAACDLGASEQPFFLVAFGSLYGLGALMEAVRTRA